MASKFGDCDYKEFIAICEQHKLAGINRTRWVDLFERAAGAAGRRPRADEEAELIAFITEGRKRPTAMVKPGRSGRKTGGRSSASMRPAG